ncbi:MarR family winged helix-turn-helix transcriptional regulator [Maritalea porphyrae]|uniref:MarR family winged helix-turn-helix transcriptional regulator n=1 Tax=Maritalea porphyrae TaxID=880732 RepID=UPI0022AF5B2A|nr:MarR family transcriptional regulator [Maritalea porphyrae]MCZ4272701.1 MarR family transcriptional regulator [Maritalea porphyrae]
MDRAQLAANQWQKEWPEINGLPMLTLGRLAEVAARIMQKEMEPFFAQHDLHAGEFDVLATLRRSGKPYALTPTQLYEATMVSSGGMTNRIDRLEKSGLVERQKNPNDRRGVIVALTKLGYEKITHIIPLHIKNEERILACLSNEDLNQLNHLTKKLLDGLQT